MDHFIARDVGGLNNMALIDDLISYWKLDEASGNATDSHGSNNLTDNNTVARVAAKINNGGDFEATASENFSIADGSQSGLDLSTDFSISAWIKMESSTTEMGVVGKWDLGVNQRSWLLTILADNKPQLYFSDDGIGNSGFKSDTALTDGVMAHVVVTVDISVPSATFYINGSAVADTATSTTDTSIHNGTAPFALGSFYSSGSATGFYDGVLDEVGVWGRILTSDEVTELYNSGNGLPYS